MTTQPFGAFKPLEMLTPIESWGKLHNTDPAFKRKKKSGLLFLDEVLQGHKHMHYRGKLQTAYRRLHPKKDKEGRVLPVRAYGESEARIIGRSILRDAAWARAMRVVKYRDLVQRLRTEQNKKHLKKVKRHRKSWQ